MFTGIVTDIGRIDAVEARGDLRVRIACGFDTADLGLGASVACSGVNSPSLTARRICWRVKGLVTTSRIFSASRANTLLVS